MRKVQFECHIQPLKPNRFQRLIHLQRGMSDKSFSQITNWDSEICLDQEAWCEPDNKQGRGTGKMQEEHY